jgi:hypothetical protein
MDAGDWSNPDARATTVALAGVALLVNAGWESLRFELPDVGSWSVDLDTAEPGWPRAVAGAIDLDGRSLVRVSTQRG